ncbi:LysR family transcriptional regulator [Rhodobacteraceae bacterium D3-12]|nr:LysR family transcriptional regulator [Rhodobacteraceae bacterium D3-12]
MDWSRLPPLAALRAFAAFAEAGNLTTAGGRLNVTHAAVSQQLRALEERLGIPLVDRAGRRNVLTPEGHRLAQALEQGFGTIAQAISELTGEDAARPVQISASPTFASAWLMPRLADLRARHPEVNLMIDASPEVRSLQAGALDIAIRHGLGDWAGLEVEPLMAAPIVVAAARSLVGDGEISGPEELTRFPWLHETGFNESTRWLAQNGVEKALERGVTALPGHLMLEAARAGQGVAILARPFVEDEIIAGRLRVLFQDPLDKHYFIVTRPGVQRATVKTVIRWLRRQKTAPHGA